MSCQPRGNRAGLHLGREIYTHTPDMGTSKMIGQRQPRRLPHVSNPAPFYWAQLSLSSPVCSPACSLLLCLVAQSCPTLCDPMDCGPPGSSVLGGSPGKDTGMGHHALLQGFFPTQGSNPGLPHCGRILYQLSHQGSP